MTTDLLHTLLLALSFLALFGLAELLYHKLHVKAELTRKLVHVGTGLITLLFPILLSNHWLVLALCGSFAIILILSLKYNLLKSINAIERKSVGSLAFPVAVYTCYLAFDYYNQQYLYFYLPMLILAFCDPLAALSGKRWPLGKYKIGNEYKSLMGSGVFFFSAAGITIFLFSYFNNGITYKDLVVAIFIALISALTEGFSKHGFDNLSIPYSVLICLILMDKSL